MSRGYEQTSSTGDDEVQASAPPRMSSSDEDWGEGRRLVGKGDGAVPSLDDLLDEVGLGRWNVGIVLICGLGNAADAVEAMCMGYILPELPGVDAAQKGFLTAAIFIGMLFGGLVCGVIADRFGRRPCLLLSLGVTAAFGLLSATMPTWTGVAFCRVAAGFGVGGAVPATFTLGIEMVPRARRGLMQNIIAAHWMIGTLFTAGLAWYMFSAKKEEPLAAGIIEPWRVYAALCALPSGITFLLVYTVVPESPRFLIVQGKYAQALRVLNVGAARHGRPPLGVVAADFGPPESERDRPKQRSFLGNVEVLMSPSLRQTTILMCGIWAALNFGWYGLLNWLPSVFTQLGLEQDAYESAFLTVAANAPGNLFAMALADRVGRCEQRLFCAVLYPKLYVCQARLGTNIRKR
jgi:VNT family MFS transporter (synaptic vesicle glycoprotein 2)